MKALNPQSIDVGENLCSKSGELAKQDNITLSLQMHCGSYQKLLISGHVWFTF